MTRARIVVLASGAGTTFQGLLDAAADPAWPGEVVALVVDRDGTGAAERAARSGVPVTAVRLGDHADRAAFDEAVLAAVSAHAPDLVVLAGWMKVLGPAVVRALPIVNTHPSLLPLFPGAHALRDALAAGVRETGATVHYVDEGVDTGPVLAQVRVPVEPGDDEDALRARVQAAERPLLVDVVRRLVQPGGPHAPAAAPTAAPRERTPE